ncbi:cardiolipin synthase ClsB [Bordetella hinzii]|uniref:Cardiolipin synthase B n=2 Tax=Bordetella hinzii TaxID=103855 RepID=A0AAN1VF76_9BORD|nr:cardiolipin synthase ClsB [Bordetella hinzii]AKQ53496.1 Putative cardiolipin synthase YbhO [Bordetella hinzii]AKQ58057.1 Putative cardiolipin synthase YbhO [Bordetella hinzii]AZW16589.1 cardiolipin synthase ClsB [Bordetella hinzii]KCB23281.1 putative cardiolipin synthetase YbhO [Bordetella hinzii OH87 BAL007II]KCB29419.1 putative cardiolipin synthetase YbhO [Bordetella hinzii L60]
MKADIVRLSWTDGNAIRLLQNGADFFPALCAAIDQASVSVHLETYIFILDRTGRQVLDCLERAARRGVKVRVVLDGFGSAATAPEVMRRINEAGGHCRVFRPEPRWLGRLKFSRSRLRRLHRKVTVIDAAIAFVGGINIVDDYDDLDPADGIAGPRFDFAVRIEGPLVPQIIYAQDLLWVRLNWARLRRHPSDWRRLRLRRPHPHHAQSRGSLRAALVLRDNLRFRQTFERAYLYGIEHARRDVLIANAYFFPGRQFRRALARAAARGVRVRLLLQGKPEYRLQYFATRSLYDQLLRDGIEIYEYMPAYLHAKVAVIDNMATVGSSNLDPFSLLLAREANVVIDDQPFAWDLQERLERAIAEGGQFIRPLDYQRRGWPLRVIDALAYTALRIGVALTGRSDKY